MFVVNDFNPHQGQLRRTFEISNPFKIFLDLEQQTNIGSYWNLSIYSLV
jgi:hypothetical protein